ncbi:hypothetical protein SPRG_01472 [Saprolegnia parasitica CBS 223.65]|uniref:Uncharacterized protein n=1 Tax=Saprolegnia parasitica (strain CBS 223.65) TaxID=695850 RepID=A0A067D6M4_SAPPC|nr:hypothetical protein SPRG_01472 [Saprolegnia parasitica CBS 223.65]KDO34336.1 hypothetical protein SPRG_01472 [Saprolegnia parasitica CBS 223.65]|eukprot:XP_012195072.1 hypothetical protein SPRG_01472 [Saprolegnia parasitica CBS 223.65]
MPRKEPSKHTRVTGPSRAVRSYMRAGYWRRRTPLPSRPRSRHPCTLRSRKSYPNTSSRSCWGSTTQMSTLKPRRERRRS